MSDRVLPTGDDPISRPEQDVLNRDALAQAFAQELLGMDASQGAVAAVTGPWGSGKTSLLNLIANHLREDSTTRVMEFNPWLFSGAHELASAFLVELAREIADAQPRRFRWRKRSASVAESLAKYSVALHAVRFVPGVGAAQRVMQDGGTGAALLLRGDSSITAERQRAVAALGKLPGRVVVLVDDIDRLDRDELRHLFRMVRLTASFPNVVYLLSLDRRVVANALTDEGFPGNEYLEKILTFTCAVPRGQPDVFRAAWLASLNALLVRHPHLQVNQDAFGQVQLEVLDPLIRTLRDAKRVLTALPLALSTRGNEVAFADLVALEACRVLAPEIHARLEVVFDGLTSLSDSGHREPELAEQVAHFITSEDARHTTVARALIETLFPAARRHLGGQRWAQDSARLWKQQGRVAAAGVLEFYLTGQLAPGVASRSTIRGIERALASVEQGRRALASIPDVELENLLEQLLPFSENAPPEAVRSAVEVLLEQLSRLRTEPRGFMDFGAEFAVTRPVLRLLRGIPPAEVYELSTQLVTRTPSLYAAFELVTLVGHRQNAGHRLVTEEQAGELEHLLRERLMQASAEEIAADRHPLRFLFHTMRPAEDASEPALPVLNDARVVAALLRDGVAVARSQTLGSTVVRNSYSLNWDMLCRLLGGETAIALAADALRSEPSMDVDEHLARALELVDRYRTGWRPSEFGDE